MTGIEGSGYNSRYSGLQPFERANLVRDDLKSGRYNFADIQKLSHQRTQTALEYLSTKRLEGGEDIILAYASRRQRGLDYAVSVLDNLTIRSAHPWEEKKDLFTHLADRTADIIDQFTSKGSADPISEWFYQLFKMESRFAEGFIYTSSAFAQDIYPKSERGFLPDPAWALLRPNEPHTIK